MGFSQNDEEKRKGMTISKIIDLLEWAEDRTNELSDGLATGETDTEEATCELAAISDLIATARARLEERKAEKKGKAR